MKYFRFGHCKDVYVKKGDRVKKGSLIGTVGTGNGQWSAHLHFDVLVKKLTVWTGYVFGWTKDEVKEAYADPAQYIKIVFPEYDHLGFDYLEHANYGTTQAPKWCYHPGKDLNGAGAGNADLGDNIFSACDGEVVYCYDGPDKNGGWGKLIVIEEIIEEPEAEEKPNISEAPKQDEVVPIPVKVLQAETVTEPTQIHAEPAQEVKGNVIPIDWNFVIEKIKGLISLIFKKK